jgi:hypothetical protein
VLQKHAFSDRLVGSFTIQINDFAMNRFEKSVSSEEQNLLLRALEVLFIWPEDFAVAWRRIENLWPAKWRLMDSVASVGWHYAR